MSEPNELMCQACEDECAALVEGMKGQTIRGEFLSNLRCGVQCIVNSYIQRGMRPEKERHHHVVILFRRATGDVTVTTRSNLFGRDLEGLEVYG